MGSETSPWKKAWLTVQRMILLVLPLWQMSLSSACQSNKLLLIKELANLDGEKALLFQMLVRFKLLWVGDKGLAGKSVLLESAHPIIGSSRQAVKQMSNLLKMPIISLLSSSRQVRTRLRKWRICCGLVSFIEIDAMSMIVSLLRLAIFLIFWLLSHGADCEVYSRAWWQGFCGRCFRDMTRIQESEPGMWTPFSLSNSYHLRFHGTLWS